MNVINHTTYAETEDTFVETMNDVVVISPELVLVVSIMDVFPSIKVVATGVVTSEVVGKVNVTGIEVIVSEGDVWSGRALQVRCEQHTTNGELVIPTWHL